MSNVFKNNFFYGGKQDYFLGLRGFSGATTFFGWLRNKSVSAIKCRSFGEMFQVLFFDFLAFFYRLDRFRRHGVSLLKKPPKWTAFSHCYLLFLLTT